MQQDIFYLCLCEDFSIFLTDAKAAAVAELENLQTVSEIYPDATEAIAAVGAVTVESATISAIEAAIATVNQCVADYKATALQALGGKYFAINTPARDNGFMKVAGTQVSGAADASSSAAVWQFECTGDHTPHDFSIVSARDFFPEFVAAFAIAASVVGRTVVHGIDAKCSGQEKSFPAFEMRKSGS